jgi:hypothetical protein
VESAHQPALSSKRASWSAIADSPSGVGEGPHQIGKSRYGLCDQGVGLPAVKGKLGELWEKKPSSIRDVAVVFATIGHRTVNVPERLIRAGVHRGQTWPDRVIADVPSHW